ncbi:YqzG/YhdC family protein [Fictibacillus nanhaiensis]|uniref:DUF3889 domain-containing protein n=1 Tax=Fictibacillus nanhaiensis TaxID=742169 RepID=UPI001C97237A|nr:DUF3889 domain-containing protein [Fictibacillus nanhaiensis]MBY6037345.1 YqzG/YhdC family protein [Fictibacillus nanhaiensis]
MKQKAFILLAVLAVVAAGCMNREQKPAEQSQNISYNDFQKGNTPMNMDTAIEQKDYAKWGKMALKETRQKYPNSKISDYDYDTRKVSPDGTITDYFDFTITQDTNKRLVKVGVMHTEDDKLIDMKFEEIS